MIAAIGFAAGLANMTDGNILFDGASLGNSIQNITWLVWQLIYASINAFCSFDLGHHREAWYCYILSQVFWSNIFVVRCQNYCGN